MKIIAVGDVHGRRFWEEVAEKEDNWNRFVLIGDYFDSWDISNEDQIVNFQDIMKFKESNIDKVVCLIGNHDEHYFPFMGNSGTSGYQGNHSIVLGHLLMTYLPNMQVAHSEGNLLFSHAGIGETWLENNRYDELEEVEYTADSISQRVEDIWKFKPLKFKFGAGFDPTISERLSPTGDNIGQTPLWIRPQSLKRDSKNIAKSGVIQVVGHTTMDGIVNLEDKYFFIDNDAKEYLFIEDGQISIKKI